jgi:hypothetical protein
LTRLSSEISTFALFLQERFAEKEGFEHPEEMCRYKVKRPLGSSIDSTNGFDHVVMAWFGVSKVNAGSVRWRQNKPENGMCIFVLQMY